MQLDSIKAAAATVWVSAVGAAGFAGNVRSRVTWLALAGIAFFPPLVMMWGWHEPRPSLSEAIQKARQ